MKALWVIGGISVTIFVFFMMIFTAVEEMDKKEREYWDAICERG